MSDSLSIKLNYKDAIVCGKDIVYYDDALQALCKWNTENNRVTIIQTYDEGIFSSYRIFKLGNCFYITSVKSAEILIYNEKTGSFSLRSHKFKNNSKVNMTQALMLNRNIWIIYQQAATLPVIYYDIDKGQFVERSFLQNYLYERDVWLPFVSSNSGCFWATVHGTDHYLKIDLLKERVIELSLADEFIKLASMYSDSQIYIFSMLNSKSLIINENTFCIKTDEPSMKEDYSYCVGLSKHIVMLPRFGNEVVIIEKNTHSLSVVRPDWDSIPECDFHGASKSVGCYENEGYIYICPQNISGIVCINKNTLQVDIAMPKFSAEIQMRTLYYRKDPGYMHLLEKNFTDTKTALKALLSCVEEVDSGEIKKQMIECSYGEQIHRSILKEIS